MYGLLFGGVRLTFDCRIGERLLDFMSVHPPGPRLPAKHVPAAKLDLAKEFAASADAAYSGYCAPLSAYSVRHYLADIGSVGGTGCDCTYSFDEKSTARNLARAPHPGASQLAYKIPEKQKMFPNPKSAEKMMGARRVAQHMHPARPYRSWTNLSSGHDCTCCSQS